MLSPIFNPLVPTPVTVASLSAGVAAISIVSLSLLTLPKSYTVPSGSVDLKLGTVTPSALKSAKLALCFNSLVTLIV